jgi:hypothetical protein
MKAVLRYLLNHIGVLYGVLMGTIAVVMVVGVVLEIQNPSSDVNIQRAATKQIESDVRAQGLPVRWGNVTVRFNGDSTKADVLVRVGHDEFTRLIAQPVEGKWRVGCKILATGEFTPLADPATGDAFSNAGWKCRAGGNAGR